MPKPQYETIAMESSMDAFEQMWELKLDERVSIWPWSDTYRQRSARWQGGDLWSPARLAAKVVDEIEDYDARNYNFFERWLYKPKDFELKRAWYEHYLLHNRLKEAFIAEDDPEKYAQALVQLRKLTNQRTEHWNFLPKAWLGFLQEIVAFAQKFLLAQPVSDVVATPKAQSPALPTQEVTEENWLRYWRLRGFFNLPLEETAATGISIAQVREKYEQLALQLHPDKRSVADIVNKVTARVKVDAELTHVLQKEVTDSINKSFASLNTNYNELCALVEKTPNPKFAFSGYEKDKRTYEFERGRLEKEDLLTIDHEELACNYAEKARWKDRGLDWSDQDDTHLYKKRQKETMHNWKASHVSYHTEDEQHYAKLVKLGAEITGQMRERYENIRMERINEVLLAEKRWRHYCQKRGIPHGLETTAIKDKDDAIRRMVVLREIKSKHQQQERGLAGQDKHSEIAEREASTASILKLM